MFGEFVIHVIVGIILTVLGGPIIIGCVALFHHHIEYWAAFLIAGCVMFGGFLLIEGDWVT